ncbi:MAG: DUF2213 domain-containing protein, partial [Candidatus Methanoperedens sp.]|nr:DUF2213 domain-containing protein [Candidatus Methanoperedens sp.]
MIKLNSTAQPLDEQGQTESLIVDGITKSSSQKDSSKKPKPDLIKTDSDEKAIFSDSIGIQIDTSKMVDTKDGLLVKDAIICRAMVLDYNGKKILKSPEALADSMPTMQRMMITDEHPMSRVIMDVSEIKGRVLPETVTLNNNVASGDLLITDKVLADEIRNGKRDLSPGYYADIIEEPGTFNDEPYEAVQKKVLYDHLAVVKLGRCSRPKCGILDSIQGALGEQAPPTINSNSSITDEKKIKETQETMAESIVVDGVGYTPEMVKKLLADSAALLEAQKTATETRKLLDAKEVAFADQGKTLAAGEARIATLEAQIDAVEQERRAPLIKHITDAMPALKIEDLKSWDFKRLTDTAASVLDAEKLKMKAGEKPSKSIIDDAY